MFPEQKSALRGCFFGSPLSVSECGGDDFSIPIRKIFSHLQVLFKAKAQENSVTTQSFG